MLISVGLSKIKYGTENKISVLAEIFEKSSDKVATKFRNTPLGPLMYYSFSNFLLLDFFSLSSSYVLLFS